MPPPKEQREWARKELQRPYEDVRDEYVENHPHLAPHLAERKRHPRRPSIADRALAAFRGDA